jgi:hypothetical protein
MSKIVQSGGIPQSRVIRIPAQVVVLVDQLFAEAAELMPPGAAAAIDLMPGDDFVRRLCFVLGRREEAQANLKAVTSGLDTLHVTEETESLPPIIRARKGGRPAQASKKSGSKAARRRGK